MSKYNKKVTEDEFEHYYDLLEQFIENETLFQLNDNAVISAKRLYDMYTRHYNIDREKVTSNRVFPRLMDEFTDRHFNKHDHYVNKIKREEGTYYKGVGAVKPEKTIKWVQYGRISQIDTLNRKIASLQETIRRMEEEKEMNKMGVVMNSNCITNNYTGRTITAGPNAYSSTTTQLSESKDEIIINDVCDQKLFFVDKQEQESNDPRTKAPDNSKIIKGSFGKSTESKVESVVSNDDKFVCFKRIETVTWTWKELIDDYEITDKK